MRCPGCGFDNPAAAKFCQECGAPQQRSCPACGARQAISETVCSRCGEALSPTVPDVQPVQYTPPRLVERIRAEQTAMEARGMVAGERKTITVLFADIVGSTALIHALDPEEARHLIDPVLALMMEAVHHYEGFVAKSLGDGILALFGAPIAHEDHAQRALYAGLRMLDSMRRQIGHSRGDTAPLQIRIGINSGEVVVRSIHKDNLHTDYDPVGDSINVASRLQTLAEPGAIMVAESTFRLTDGYFAFEARPHVRLKGVPQPVCVYRLVGPGTLRTRLQVAARRGLAGFVGRQSERRRLRQALAQTQGGHGRIVAIVGEPGVGKSRLLYEFKQELQGRCRVLETFSVSHGKAYPYLPLIELLRNYFQLMTGEDAASSRRKVHDVLLALDGRLTEGLPYLLHLLGLEQGTVQLAQMDPQVRRQRTFDMIRQLFVYESRIRPLVVLFEDLQWLDVETEEFLNGLADEVAATRILLLVNYRPEYRHRGGPWPDCEVLCLEPLGRAEAIELIETLLGRRSELEALRRLILAKTEGNPFFIEELVRALVEQGVLRGEDGHYRLHGTPGKLEIPPNVQGVLAARMDRLPSREKGTLQTLAVIGKEFSLSLARQVLALSEDDVRHRIRLLQDGDFLFERPAYPEVEYSFRHALTQQVAYNSLLGEQRAELHARTGLAIEQLFAGQLDTHYNELAHHFSLSGETAKGIHYLRCAGRQALQRSAYREAREHLGQALELLQRLPESSERTGQELDLQLEIGPVLMSVCGPAAPELEATYIRALTLSRQSEDRRRQFLALFGVKMYYHVRGDFLTARDLAEQLLALAHLTEDRALLLEAHVSLGSTLFHLGELERVRELLEQVPVLYDIEQHRDHSARFGMDPGVIGLSMLGRVLWYLGFPDQARARIDEALALARELGYPYELGFALVFAAEVYLHRRQRKELVQTLDASLAITEEQGFRFWNSWAHILRAWVEADSGETGIGVLRLGHWVDEFRATGAGLWMAHFLGLIADIHGKTGHVDEGLTLVDEALNEAKHSHERICEPELLRVRADLLIRRAWRVDGAEALLGEADLCLRQAIECARPLQARSLGLRAAISLTRLWAGTANEADARARLAEVYGTFGEGFDSRDLSEARALLGTGPDA